jgi:aspartate/methionine/tyrosine aminotransferase
VRTSSHHNPRNHSSAARKITQDMIVAQVRFYDNAEEAQSHVRFAFCKKEDVLREALRRLAG